jgi:hypothetical protein
MMLVLAAALWTSGCGEEPVPAASEAPPADEPVSGDADAVLGEASEDFVAVMDEMPAPAPGQWISYGSDSSEGEVSVAVISSEEVQGVACLWYQFSLEDNVIQVLVDQTMFDGLRGEMQDFLREMGDDPSAWIQANLEGGDPSALFIPRNDPERMLAMIRAVKMIRIKDGEQIIALDMTGVPELVEQMIAQNPDLFSQATAGMNAEPDPEFQEFMAQVQEAEFVLDHEEIAVGGGNMGCVTLAITHPDQGTISLAFSSELPIFPLAEASAVPVDPAEDGGTIFVTGFGMEGAEDLMPGPATQTIPAAMMLQGLMQQSQQSPQM